MARVEVQEGCTSHKTSDTSTIQIWKRATFGVMGCGEKSHNRGPLHGRMKSVKMRYGVNTGTRNSNQPPHDPMQRVACAVPFYQILLTTHWHKT